MAGKNFVEIIGLMGPLAKGVMALLALMSVYAIGVGLERLLAFHRAQRQSRRLLEELAGLWREGRAAEAERFATDVRFRGSHLARVLAAGLRELQRQEKKSPVFASENLDAVQRAIERERVAGVHDFKRGLTGLATIGSTGPFVGLFGTVAGIITAFSSMSATGSPSMGTVASGIAEALVTTGFGIVVAVVAVWFFNSLLSRVEIFGSEMANASSELIDRYLDLKTQQS